MIPGAVQEMFIQYLAEQGHNVVKSERKPRKTIQYKDLGQLLTRPSTNHNTMLIRYNSYGSFPDRQPRIPLRRDPQDHHL